MPDWSLDSSSFFELEKEEIKYPYGTKKTKTEVGEVKPLFEETDTWAFSCPGFSVFYCGNDRYIVAVVGELKSGEFEEFSKLIREWLKSPNIIFVEGEASLKNLGDSPVFKDFIEEIEARILAKMAGTTPFRSYSIPPAFPSPTPIVPPHYYGITTVPTSGNFVRASDSFNTLNYNIVNDEKTECKK